MLRNVTNGEPAKNAGSAKTEIPARADRELRGAFNRPLRPGHLAKAAALANEASRRASRNEQIF